ncbi:NAD-binding oxidoreductase [Stigmatella sp. ncwal1]|uniref:NAD-binding oxidoreductase n=1 Tax=Stigmatella ashevillensis TaxID=2995309 RepID=A0ABT5DBH7_9BACT|nr:NAD-binding oxidoreductase [Stigmatella ashevillena]MDC0710871.1 NAD-binding oxidoreductase [Stigmatella ashevillena]
MKDWFPATLVARSLAADGLTDLTLDVSLTSVAHAHQRPGQYTWVRLPGYEEGVFAIASPPGIPGRWDLLLKEGSPLPEALVRLPLGARMEVTRPAGRGFPLDQAKGRDLLLFATGSGISAIRSVIESLRRDRDAYGRVTLYFGVRTPSAFAYARDFHSWEQARIRVVATVSQPGASGWQGLTGYVQGHLAEESLAPGTVAFLCGQKDMLQKVIETLKARGLAAEDIHQNV